MFYVHKIEKTFPFRDLRYTLGLYNASLSIEINEKTEG